MGDPLRAEVTAQLSADLEYYRPGSVIQNLQIDWSNVCQEGHCTEFLGGRLEEMSDVRVTTASGDLVAEGWIDFVQGGAKLPLFVFWLFLDIVTNDGHSRIKDGVHIPDHIWDRLPTETKQACSVETGYDVRTQKSSPGD